MEVEFVYHITGRGNWEELRHAAERAVRLNRNFTGFDIEPPADGEDSGVARLRSSGHDRSAISRRIVSPIRALFQRAGVTHDRITLMQQTVTPNGRSLKLNEGRTPKGTFATAELPEMLADAAKVDELP